MRALIGLAVGLAVVGLSAGDASAQSCKRRDAQGRCVGGAGSDDHAGGRAASGDDKGARTPPARPSLGTGGGKACSTAAECQTRCDDGKAAACNALGDRYKEGNGVPIDGARAMAAWQKACDAGLTVACGSVGEAYFDGKLVAEDNDRARTLLEAACRDGDARACALRAFLPWGGWAVPQDRELAKRDLARLCRDKKNGRACVILHNVHRELGEVPTALDFLDRGCRNGAAAACHTLGQWLLDGEGGTERDEAKGRKTLERGCSQGHGASCRQLGTHHRAGRFGKKDGKAALRWFEKGCKALDGSSCDLAGDVLVSGDAGPRAPKKAREQWNRACALGWGWGCYSAGNLLRDGDETAKLPVDLAAAAVSYGQGCDLGFGPACNQLGLRYEQGQGVDLDVARAVQLYTRACEAQGADAEPYGCNNLGNLYHRGFGGKPKDDFTAGMFYDRACNASIANSCHQLGGLFWGGSGVQPDKVRANEYFKKGCELGALASCYDLGTSYRDGDGIGRDLEQARELMKKACEGGVRSACDDLGRLQQL